MPTEPKDANQQVDPPVGTPPAPPQTPAPGTEVSVGTTPQGGSTPPSPPGSPSTTAAQPGSGGWWTGLGLPADETAAQAEVRQMRERLDQYSARDPMINAFTAYQGEFADFLENRDQYLQYRKSAQPAQPAPWFADLGELYAPMQWDPSWANHVMEDPASGALVLRPNGRPDILAKAQSYLDRTRKIQQKFWENPAEYIRPIVEKLATQQAQQIVSAQFGAHAEAQNMAQFEAQHARWLYENDGKNFKFAQRWNPKTGRNEPVRVMTKQGQRFCELVQQRHDYQRQRGHLDLEDQLHWAMQALENEFYRSQASPAAGGTTQPPATPPDTRSPREKANDTWLNGQGKEAPVPPGVLATADMAPLAPNEIAPSLLSAFTANGVKPEHFVR